MAPLPPPLSELTKEQKDHLQRLWKCHHRELIDVKTSAEAKAKPVQTPSCRFVVRVHAFLVAFLQSALDASTRPLTDESTRLVKDARHSCLKPYAKFALSLNASSNTVRLVEGRRVIALHHEDFLSELNHFELKGQSASQEFIRRESYGAYLYHMPSDALAALGCSMGLAITTLWRRQLEQQQQQQGGNTDATSALQTLDRFLDSTQIVVRFAHVEPQVQMMDIKTGLVGKFVSVRGNVVKARPKRLRVATADFSCQKCGALVTHAFESGRYSLPTKCVTQQCRSKAFSLIRPTARYINVQDLRLQEAQEESTNHAGRTPRQMEVELAHDLVDAVRPGDSILVAATVAAINTAFAAGKTGKKAMENSTFKLYLHGHSVTTMSESNQRGNKKGSQVVYTQQQLQNITQLCHADHRYFGLTERRAFPFDLLVRSLCPSIIGHNQVKAGLLLCLLGGTPPSSQSTDKGNSIRCNSHILIVGDPGTYFVAELFWTQYCASLLF
jgi:DNA replicative helicase MCM subunit Mcm2 (Cdc46/Mcm family)